MPFHNAPLPLNLIYLEEFAGENKSPGSYTISVLFQNTFSLNLSQLQLWSIAWREGTNKLGQTI